MKGGDKDRAGVFEFDFERLVLPAGDLDFSKSLFPKDSRGLLKWRLLGVPKQEELRPGGLIQDLSFGMDTVLSF